MKTPHPHAFALARAVIDLQRDRPEQPIGGLINALFVWITLPMLIPDGEKWRRFLFDTRTGQRTPIRPNQFACLVKRTAVTPSVHGGALALTIGFHPVGDGTSGNFEPTCYLVQRLPLADMSHDCGKSRLACPPSRARGE